MPDIAPDPWLAVDAELCRRDREEKQREWWYRSYYNRNLALEALRIIRELKAEYENTFDGEEMDDISEWADRFGITDKELKA